MNDPLDFMSASRRRTLQQAMAVAGLLSTVGLVPRKAWAASPAFDARTVQDVIKAMGSGALAESREVQLTAPDMAENGAVVPMGVASTLTNVKHLLLLVEKNPAPLVARFDLNPMLEANFLTRAKMGQSSDVYAVAITTDGRALYTKKEVKVTFGGCGG